jgi:hypothetical protein
MKISHLKLTERKLNDKSQYNYHFLARVKFGVFSSSLYNCILTSSEGCLCEHDLKKNMKKISKARLKQSERQDPAQRFFSGSNSHQTPLGHLYMQKFRSIDYMLIGDEKHWGRFCR